MFFILILANFSIYSQCNDFNLIQIEKLLPNSDQKVPKYIESNLIGYKKYESETVKQYFAKNGNMINVALTSSKSFDDNITLFLIPSCYNDIIKSIKNKYHFESKDAGASYYRNGNVLISIPDKQDSRGRYVIAFYLVKTSETEQQLSSNNVQNLSIKSSSNGSKVLLEDYFKDNRNNWASATEKHILMIGNNRMIYENKEKADKVYSMVGVPISVVSNDNYTIEVSFQSLTPCQNDVVDNLISIVSKSPKPVYYGFAIGDKETNILFAAGSNLISKEMRDNIKYTCVPSYFITSLIGGESNYLQTWTKNTSVSDGFNVNILKLIKRDGSFSFYINNRLVTTKNSYSLGNDNAVSIVASAKSKIAVNYVKVFRN